MKTLAFEFNFTAAIEHHYKDKSLLYGLAFSIVGLFIWFLFIASILIQSNIFERSEVRPDNNQQNRPELTESQLGII